MLIRFMRCYEYHLRCIHPGSPRFLNCEGIKGKLCDLRLVVGVWLVWDVVSFPRGICTKWALTSFTFFDSTQIGNLMIPVNTKMC